MSEVRAVGAACLGNSDKVSSWSFVPLQNGEVQGGCSKHLRHLVISPQSHAQTNMFGQSSGYFLGELENVSLT